MHVSFTILPSRQRSKTARGRPFDAQAFDGTC